MEEARGAVVADGEVAAAGRAGKDTTEEGSASTDRSRDQGLDRERTPLWLRMTSCRLRRRGSGRVGRPPPSASGPDTEVWALASAWVRQSGALVNAPQRPWLGAHSRYLLCGLADTCYAKIGDRSLAAAASKRVT